MSHPQKAISASHLLLFAIASSPAMTADGMFWSTLALVWTSAPMLQMMRNNRRKYLVWTSACFEVNKTWIFRTSVQEVWLLSPLNPVLGCISQHQLLGTALPWSWALFLGCSCLLEVGKIFAPLTRLAFSSHLKQSKRKDSKRYSLPQLYWEHV